MQYLKVESKRYAGLNPASAPTNPTPPASIGGPPRDGDLLPLLEFITGDLDTSTFLRSACRSVVDAARYDHCCRRCWSSCLGWLELLRLMFEEPGL